VIREGTVHAWHELVGRGERRRVGTPRRNVDAGASPDEWPTRALSRFVGQLKTRQGPVVVDLGPAMGGNVSFLGEQLGCKLYVEDVLSNLETWGPLPELAEEDAEIRDGGSLERNDDARRLRVERARQKQAAGRVFPRDTGSIDGVLCWDVIDFLEPDAAEALAAEVTRILSPGGVVYLCHGADGSPTEATLYEIVDAATLRYRAGPTDLPERRVWQSRAILHMFGELAVCDSFLLTSRMREMVLRKAPAETSAG